MLEFIYTEDICHDTQILRITRLCLLHALKFLGVINHTYGMVIIRDIYKGEGKILRKCNVLMSPAHSPPHSDIYIYTLISVFF